jgi:hypothetical protein
MLFQVAREREGDVPPIAKLDRGEASKWRQYCATQLSTSVNGPRTPSSRQTIVLSQWETYTKRRHL